jgi:hypothetical protein
MLGDLLRHPVASVGRPRVAHDGSPCGGRSPPGGTPLAARRVGGDHQQPRQRGPVDETYPPPAPPGLQERRGHQVLGRAPRGREPETVVVDGAAVHFEELRDRLSPVLAEVGPDHLVSGSDLGGHLCSVHPGRTWLSVPRAGRPGRPPARTPPHAGSSGGVAYPRQPLGRPRSDPAGHRRAQHVEGHRPLGRSAPSGTWPPHRGRGSASPVRGDPDRTDGSATPSTSRSSAYDTSGRSGPQCGVPGIVRRWLAGRGDRHPAGRGSVIAIPPVAGTGSGVERPAGGCRLAYRRAPPPAPPEGGTGGGQRLLGGAAVSRRVATGSPAGISPGRWSRAS